MKYYFPTSTLNFDAIYSGMSIMPPRYYCDEAIWFSRYLKSGVEVSDDFIVLYSKPIKWQIYDDGTVNYPMLVEIDSNVVDAFLSDNVHVVRKMLKNGVFCVLCNIPMTFRAADVLSGNIRIIFRNQEERKSLEVRARVGVLECKLAEVFRNNREAIFDDGFPADAIDVESVKSEALIAVNDSGLKFEQKDFEDFERKERQSGAEIGFLAGKWIRSMRDGYCLDCFRDGLNFSSWKKTLPVEFGNVINMLCNKIGFHWDVNREAIVNFCSECWNTCFGSSEKSVTIDQWHMILRKIARYHSDMTFNYPIDAIPDAHMQALACFINAGKRHNLLTKSIRDDNVAMPELALSLYGALVGYSVFSRTIFERRSYENAPQPQSPSPATKRRPPMPPFTTPHTPYQQPSLSTLSNRGEKAKVPVLQHGILEGWAQKIWDLFVLKVRPALSTSSSYKKKKIDEISDSLKQLLESCTDKNEVMRRLPSAKGWGQRSRALKEMIKVLGDETRNSPAKSEYLFDLNASTLVPLESDPCAEGKLLVDDANLPDVIRNHFPDERQLADKILLFCQKYRPDGYYGKNPIQYRRENPDLIDHLLRCFRSDKTIELNFVFKTKSNEERFIHFLEDRYRCKRKVHGA